ncbi:hypothetical protein [Lacticaseibacillus kribbianus]|uniref:hypothetical protein n=1 Tax=Lacticaseibacillus kribbianus TaxID=2926292 RepID=UPI001CD536D3|nr:hypothetical protein [Lacticaseibacillus kribbianus]
MIWWLMAVIAVVALIFAVLVVRALRRRRALRLFLARNQRVCDQVVTAALTALGWPESPLVPAAPVADVWGHGIAAFEYVTLAPDSDAEAVTKATLGQALVDAAAEMATAGQVTVTPEAAAEFVVTDFWLRDGLIHFDVARLVNPATREYVEDVRRV